MVWLGNVLRARLRVHVLIAFLSALGVGVAVLIPEGVDLWSEWKAAQLRAAALPRYAPTLLRVCSDLSAGKVSPDHALDAGRPYAEALFSRRVYSIGDMAQDCASASFRRRIAPTDYRLGREYQRSECFAAQDVAGARQFARDELSCDMVEIAMQGLAPLVPPFVEFKSQRGRSLSSVLASSVQPLGFIAFVVFGALLAGRLLATETHAGWRRIGIIAAGGLPLLLAIGVYVNSEELTPEGIVLTLGGIIIGPIAVLGARRVVGWVHEGFDSAGRRGSSARGESSVERSNLDDRRGLSKGNSLELASISQAPSDAIQQVSTRVTAERVLIAHSSGRAVEADFWPRTAARAIDLCLALMLSSIVAVPGFFIDPEKVRGGWILLQKMYELCWIVLTVIAYEIVLTAITGRTIGKWIVGLQIVMSGDESPTMLQLGRRTLKLLTFGVYWMVFFPYAQLIGAYRAYLDLGKNRGAIWDRDIGSRVIQRSAASWRTLVALILAALLLVLAVVGQRVAKDGTHRRFQESYLGQRR